MVVVTGYVIRYPLGGMTWVFLNFLLGLHDLGFEPVFMEVADYQLCFDVDTGEMTDDPSYGVAYWRGALARHGLADLRWWFRSDDGRDWGMSGDEAIAILDDAAGLLNVGGSCWSPEFARARPCVLVDCDAPFTQFQLAEDDEETRQYFDAHDVLATYAVNLAAGTTQIPTGGRKWVATRPPVHLSSFDVTPVPRAGSWTTVTSWDAYGSAWWDLEEYRQKDVEFARLRELPSMVSVPIELALAGNAPIAQLEAFGWRCVDPYEVTRTAELFQRFIRQSRGELAVAKGAFVKAQTGAISDRSVAYLAMGRPVVVSDTGLGWLPVGDGLLPFSDAASAATAIVEAESNMEAHSRAARLLAVTHFASDVVLTDLLAEAGVVVPDGGSDPGPM
ncbi:MAG: hypothetical protein JWO37_3013 [Acidimicrobiales bacterium]|nr:hypothetical protein [Acidimicrobiales bacterium]